MASYRDYCNEEKAAGRKPLSMKDWALARSAPEPVAEGMADPNPGIENDPEDTAALPAEDAAVVERVQAQAEDPLKLAAELRAKAAQLEASVNGATPEDQKQKREDRARERGKWVFHSPYSRFLNVKLISENPHTVNGHHYAGRHVAADFSYGNWSTEDPHLAELLMATDDYKNGLIYLVDEKIQSAVVGISDGPRTSSTLSPRVRRPAGALSAPLD
jgi:hypothetical protein